MEQHVQEATSRNASQRGAKAYNSCICLPGNALVQDNKEEDRIICCPQVLGDFWVDLLSLRDVNKTYLNATAFAFLGQGPFFGKTAERRLGDSAESEYGFYFGMNSWSEQLARCSPFPAQPHTTQTGSSLFLNRLLGFAYSVFMSCYYSLKDLCQNFLQTWPKTHWD